MFLKRTAFLICLGLLAGPALAASQGQQAAMLSDLLESDDDEVVDVETDSDGERLEISELSECDELEVAEPQEANLEAIERDADHAEALLGLVGPESSLRSYRRFTRYLSWLEQRDIFLVSALDDPFLIEGLLTIPLLEQILLKMNEVDGVHGNSSDEYNHLVLFRDRVAKHGNKYLRKNADNPRVVVKFIRYMNMGNGNHLGQEGNHFRHLAYAKGGRLLFKGVEVSPEVRSLFERAMHSLRGGRGVAAAPEPAAEAPAP